MILVNLAEHAPPSLRTRRAVIAHAARVKIHWHADFDVVFYRVPFAVYLVPMCMKCMRTSMGSDFGSYFWSKSACVRLARSNSNSVVAIMTNKMALLRCSSSCKVVGESVLYNVRRMMCLIRQILQKPNPFRARNSIIHALSHIFRCVCVRHSHFRCSSRRRMNAPGPYPEIRVGLNPS